MELKNLRFDLALENFTKVLKIDPKNQDAKKGELNVLICKGKQAIKSNKLFKFSLNYFNKASSIDPINNEVRQGLKISLIG